MSLSQETEPVIVLCRPRLTSSKQRDRVEQIAAERSKKVAANVSHLGLAAGDRSTPSRCVLMIAGGCERRSLGDAVSRDRSSSSSSSRRFSLINQQMRAAAAAAMNYSSASEHYRTGSTVMSRDAERRDATHVAPRRR